MTGTDISLFALPLCEHIEVELRQQNAIQAVVDPHYARDATKVVPVASCVTKTIKAVFDRYAEVIKNIGELAFSDEVWLRYSKQLTARRDQYARVEGQFLLYHCLATNDASYNRWRVDVIEGFKDLCKWFLEGEEGFWRVIPSYDDGLHHRIGTKFQPSLFYPCCVRGGSKLCQRMSVPAHVCYIVYVPTVVAVRVLSGELRVVIFVPWKRRVEALPLLRSSVYVPPRLRNSETILSSSVVFTAIHSEQGSFAISNMDGLVWRTGVGCPTPLIKMDLANCAAINVYGYKLTCNKNYVIWT